MFRDDWFPSADQAALAARAKLLEVVRSFFRQHGFLEVETPLLASGATTDPHLASLTTSYTGPGHSQGTELYLQTSPELAMKRLLAAGSGPIFQICKAFRDGEAGRSHNPEFTILEWYLPAVDYHRLMDSVEDLLVSTLAVDGCERSTYEQVWLHHLGVDPHRASAEELSAVADQHDLRAPSTLTDVDDWQALLMSHLIEPQVGLERPLLIYDYPASQAALARIRTVEPPIAERFEVYFRGVELANGFEELTDATEQRRRFEAELAQRRRLGLPLPPIDERFLSALEAGLPACSGVALGFDRLLMLRLGAATIDEVLAFPIDRV